MSQLEVNISKSNQNVSTITKVVDENSITSLLGALQKAKDESNDFLTSLVEKDKLKTAAVKDRKDVKRKSCEALEGMNEGYINFK